MQNSQKNHHWLESLKRGLQNGSLSCDEVCEEMIREVDRELSKSDDEVDIDWLEACGELLVYADQLEAIDAVDPSVTTWQAIQSQIHEYEEDRHRRYASHFIRIAACFIFVISTCAITIHFKWIAPSNSYDGQEFILTGNEIEFDLTSMADAFEDSGTTREITTTDFSRLCDFLGFVPAHPTWLPDEWALENCYSYVDANTELVDLTYQHIGHEDSIILSNTYLRDPSSLSASIYQDDVGELLQLDDGRSVYLTRNNGEFIVAWYGNNSYSYLISSASYEDLLKIVMSIE